MSRRLRLVLLLSALGACAATHADWQTRSWSRWQIGADSAEVQFGVEQVELQRMRGSVDTAWLATELATGISLGDGAQSCVQRNITRLPAVDTQLQYRIDFVCRAALVDPVAGVRVFLGQAGNPLHYADFTYGGNLHSSFLYTRGEQSRALPGTPAPVAPWRTAGAYLVLGFEHILAGTDHVAFLLCMLLAARRLAARVWMITGFTVGHSITLSLSVLGLVRVAGAAVEALIGFTVALLAVEVFARAEGGRFAALLLLGVVSGLTLHSLGGGAGTLPLQSLLALMLLTPCYLLLALRQQQPDALHLGMTAVFGLVHGIGFASVLKLLGLPPGQQGWALAGFNIGVEAGQLLLLLGFALVIHAAGKLPGAWSRALAERLSAGTLCALGIYWLVGRSIA